MAISIASSKLKTLQSNITITAASNAAPIAITASAAHGLETGDILQISAVTGNLAANGLHIVTVVDSTHFSLNQSNGSGAWVSGGTCAHIGFQPASIAVDNTVYAASNPSWSLNIDIFALTAGSSIRAHFQDSANGTFVDAQPGPTFGFPGALNGLKQFSASWKDFTLNFGNAGNSARLLLFISGGPGSSATFTATLS